MNFSRAAERLHIAQPALSKQIRNLEEELGGRLFHRTTTKVTLTEMGYYFQQQTRRLLMQLDIAVTGAQQLSRGKTGTLRVGCDWRMIGLPIALAARKLTELNPRLLVEFVERPVFEQVGAVRDRAIDIGFAGSIFLGATDDLELRPVFTLKMKVLLPLKHRLAQHSHVSLSDLKNDRWLILDPQSLGGYQVMMSQILQYTPKLGMTTTSMAGIVAHVVAAHGVGLIPDWGAPWIEPGTVLVESDSTPLEVFAVSNRNFPSPLVDTYLDALEEAIAARKPRS